jgi:hypothetical protein
MIYSNYVNALLRSMCVECTSYVAVCIVEPVYEGPFPSDFSSGTSEDFLEYGDDNGVTVGGIEVGDVGVRGGEEVRS